MSKLVKMKARLTPISYAIQAQVGDAFNMDALAQLFIKLEEKFTRYELKQISQLTSVYSIRLYELLIRWRSTGKLYVPIADLREKLGLLEDEDRKSVV